MPFKSQSQRRFFYAAAARGEIPRATVRRWEKETPRGKKLPEKVMRKKADSALKDALDNREDARQLTLKQLARMRDPEVRKRYLADMSAKNHSLAVEIPKTASFDAGVVAAMEKVAARDEDKEGRRARSAMGAVGAMTGAGLGNLAVSPIQQRLMKSIKEHGATASPQDIERMKKHLKIPGAEHKEVGSIRQAVAVPKGGSSPKPMHGLESMQYEAMGLPRGHREAMKGGKPGTAYAPSKMPEIVGHELGHLNLRRKPGRRAVLRHARALGGGAGMIGGGVMAARGEEGSASVKAAPAVAAAGQLPTLVDEGLASVRGYKAMKKSKAMNPAQLRTARRNLAKAFGTYGLRSLAAVAPVAAISAMRWKKKDDSK